MQKWGNSAAFTQNVVGVVPADQSEHQGFFLHFGYEGEVFLWFELNRWHGEVSVFCHSLYGDLLHLEIISIEISVFVYAYNLFN